MNNFEEKALFKFSWMGLFGVTGISFMAFGFVLKLLGDEFPGLFIKIGLVSLGISLFCLLNSFYIKKQ